MEEYKRDGVIQNGELGRDDVEEMALEQSEDAKQTVGAENLLCNPCLIAGQKMATYLCYMCSVYLCRDCFKKHKNHEWVKLGSNENERVRKAESFIRGMRHEGRRDRELERENIQVYGRVNVKHVFDKNDCYVTGLCGLERKKWVALDYNNSCMKIVCSVTHALLRYIRFGSQPWDATEITVKQEFGSLDSAGDYKTVISDTNGKDSDKYRLLAVTFPFRQQIWLVDTSKGKAIKIKSIQLHNYCRSIDFSDDKIFTLCEEYLESGTLFSVGIFFAEGTLFKNIEFNNLGFFTDLSVYKEQCFVTDYINNKVLCINNEGGSDIPELIIEGSAGPKGISVVPSDKIYVCGERLHSVYALSLDLLGIELVSVDTKYTEGPDRICFAGGKLLVSHFPSLLRNFITVIQVT